MSDTQDCREHCGAGEGGDFGTDLDHLLLERGPVQCSIFCVEVNDRFESESAVRPVSLERRLGVQTRTTGAGIQQSTDWILRRAAVQRTIHREPRLMLGEEEL